MRNLGWDDGESEKFCWGTYYQKPTHTHNTHFQLIKKFHPYALKWKYKILLKELKGCSILGDQKAYLTEGLESF